LDGSRIGGLRATLRPISLLWGRFDGEGWWKPLRTPAGPATLLVARRGDGVTGTAWGPGRTWVLDRLDAIVGLHDVDGFEPADERIARLYRRNPSRFGRTGAMFEALVQAVLEQKVTGAEAKTALRAITHAYSEPAPGPRARLMLPPDPARLAGSRYHDLHDLGVERRRSELVLRLASEAHRLERLADLPAAEAGRRLAPIPGVGRWTIAETLVVTHGDTDAVSVGDYHLKHQVVWHLAGRERGTDQEMLELLEPFRPHRARVVRLLEALPTYPRRGPRMPVRRFSSL
jgi:3-methyladenine DNA glycosylase/8-oxoguanine DNA glycosylase